ncbi:MAG: MBL fold metallo-hydrolase, partial [Chlorobiales bacterium]|nr:MBL fold metallo-hydrolase [Chlorobiales bacterium]
MSIRSIQRIRENILVLQEKSWRVNMTAVKTHDGVVIVDSFPSPFDAHIARETIFEEFNKEVTLVINTHHHYDHVLGNQVFDKA